MKKVIFILALACSSMVNAQAFKGAGDNKVQVGANIQSGAQGLFVSYDYGIGENMSLGLSSTFLLGFGDGVSAGDVKFGDKVDLKARFNANIGNVLKFDENLDIYPGLDIGLKNFGAHLGVRYFFTPGFGVFTELAVPIAKYNSDSVIKSNNQFAFNFGMAFNI